MTNKMTNKWFIVHVNCTISGHVYRHGVAYRMPQSLEACVTDMVKQKMATIFDREVRIVSGKAYPIGEAGQGQKPMVFAPSPSMTAGSISSAPLSPNIKTAKTGNTTLEELTVVRE